MMRHGIEASAAAMLLSLVRINRGGAGRSRAGGWHEAHHYDGGGRTQGGATADKEPFPTAALPEGKGYELKAPNAEGRWEVSTYRWDPSQIIVNQGDEVTLEILGVNGAEHPTVIDGYDLSFTVKRGQLTTVTFTADKAGVFQFRCGTHQPSMVGELIVLPGA